MINSLLPDFWKSSYFLFLFVKQSRTLYARTTNILKLSYARPSRHYRRPWFWVLLWILHTIFFFGGDGWVFFVTNVLLCTKIVCPISRDSTCIQMIAEFCVTGSEHLGQGERARWNICASFFIKIYSVHQSGRTWCGLGFFFSPWPGWGLIFFVSPIFGFFF